MSPNHILLLIILITIPYTTTQTINTPRTNTSSNVSFSNIDMAALLQSLGMTQNDLNNLRDSVNAGNSAPTSQPTAISTTNTAISTTNTAISTTNTAISTTNNSPPSTSISTDSDSNQSNNKTAITGSDLFKLTDLSDLQKQLGLDAKPGQANLQSINVSATTNKVDTKPIQTRTVSPSNTASTSVQTNVKNFMPQVNAQKTSEPTNTERSAVVASTTSISSSSNYDFLSQFNSLLTANNGAVIPLNSPVSTSSQVNSIPGFMDLTSLQEQLGLITKPPLNPTQTRMNNTQSADNKTTNSSNTSVQSTQSSKSNQIKNSTNSVSNTTAASPTQTSNTTISQISNSTSQTKSVFTSIPDSSAQTVSSDSKTTSSDPSELLQSLADLQKLLDQLSQNKTATSSNPSTASTNSSVTPIINSNRDSSGNSNTNKQNTNTSNSVQNNSNTAPSISQPTRNNTTISTQITNTTASIKDGSTQSAKSDDNAPAVIDVGNMTVLYSVYKDNKLFTTLNNTNNNTSTSNNQQINNKDNKINQQIQSTVTNPSDAPTQSTSLIKQEIPKTNKSSQVVDQNQNKPVSNSQPVVVNQNINSVYVSPIPTIPKNNLQTQNIPPVTTTKNALSVPVSTQNLSAYRVQSYQQISSSNLAVYSLNTSYKQFANSFILAINDPYLSALRTYLSTNYGAYLNQGSLISGFRAYSTYDDSIQYQLLYKTIYGTFNAIINYNLSNDAIVLKSLSVINFFILEVQVSNCLTKDDSQNYCKVCNAGYRNFMGRCRQWESRCLQYMTDECGACAFGSVLSRGLCM